MKKAIVFATIAVCLLLAVSCDNASPQISFSPPAWTIGTWSITAGGNTIRYTFTADDILYETEGSSTISFWFSDMYRACTVEIHSSDGDSYDFSIIADGEEIGRYTFVSLSATTLNYSIESQAGSSGPLVLTKE